VWGYHVPVVDDGEVDRHIRHFHHVVVGPYWPAARQIIEDRFTTIPFSFDEVAAPAFAGLDRSRDVHFPLFVRAGRPTRRSSPA
jgi:hypothetical protein